MDVPLSAPPSPVAKCGQQRRRLLKGLLQQQPASLFPLPVCRLPSPPSIKTLHHVLSFGVLSYGHLGHYSTEYHFMENTFNFENYSTTVLINHVDTWG